MCPLEACKETWLLYWNAGCSFDNTGSYKGSGKIGKARPAPHTLGSHVNCQFIRRVPLLAPNDDCLPVLTPCLRDQPLTWVLHFDSGKENLKT